MITDERKAELTDEGYAVEDMGVVHGVEFAGQFRWLNSITRDFQESGNSENRDFQDYDSSDSEADAWGEADAHAVYTALLQERLRADAKLTAEQLNAKYNPDGGGQHPQHPMAYWRYAVKKDATVVGYWAWVVYKLDQWALKLERTCAK